MNSKSVIKYKSEIKSKAFLNYILIFLFPAALIAQSQSGYTIHGHLEGLQDGEIITMDLSNSKGIGMFGDFMGSKDTCTAKNGNYILKGVVPEGPRRYYMTFSKSKKKLNLFIDNNQDITISSSTDINKIDNPSLEHDLPIVGSPTNHSLLCLETMEDLYWQSTGRVNNYAKKLKDSLGFNGPLLSSVYAIRDEINRAYYYNFFAGDRDPEDGRRPDRIISNLCLPTSFADFQRSGHAAFWKGYYDSLSEYRKNGFFGKWMKELVALCVGQPFPAFSFPDAENKQVTLNDILAKGKYTLIQFWSSKSPNAKEYQEDLRLYYKKYHDNGLAVIGISSDTYLDDWKKSLTDQPLPWTNVIDLQGKIVEKVYREYGLRGSENTTNVLLDAKGIIVAWDILDVELEWNLWKCFEQQK